MLKQYELFLDSFQFACKNYKGSTKDADIAKVMGFESKDEYSREEVDLFSDDEAEEGTQPISHEDYKRLIKYLEKKNPPAILPIQIAYYAGLRIGETCGLTWQDINLEEQCLTIKRSMANYITAITTKNCI